MKKSFKLIALVCLSVLMVTSCGKDKEEEKNEENPTATVTSEMTYSGTTYALKSGFFFNYGKDDDPNDGFDYDGTNFDFVAFTDGVNADVQNDSISGNGFYLYMELFSTGEITPAQGVYQLNQTFAVNTFDQASITVVTNGEDGVEITFVSGSITIEKSASNYKVTGTLTNANGNKLEIKYSGPTPIL